MKKLLFLLMAVCLLQSVPVLAAGTEGKGGGLSDRGIEHR